MLWIPGEIGGYMGLLLGGSAITVVEFIDLLIYNFFRRNCKRKRLGSSTKVKPFVENGYK
jgi:hypothetical protein